MNIVTVNAGDAVEFQYLEKVRTYNSFPVNTQYIVENYAGKILCVRNVHEDPLSMRTVERYPLLERSQFLMTVQFNDGKIKSFYTKGMGYNINLCPLVIKIWWTNDTLKYVKHKQFTYLWWW